MGKIAGKVKKWYRSVPLWLTLMLTVAAALVIAGFSSRAATSAAYNGVWAIQSRHMTCTTTGELEGGVIYHVDLNYHFEKYSASELRLYRFCSFAARYAPVFIYTVCIVLAALAFYLTKLRRPLGLLEHASRRIAENELDFALDYDGRDEMARLCRAFEVMRRALDTNNRRMLRLIDEQHQLNDAYTHDLRTPIAVLKGYTDMLTKYLPSGKMPEAEVLETVRTMSAHVSRLEQFVGSMNAVQRLSDVEIRRESVPAEDFVCGLRETADILCEGSPARCRVASDARGTLGIDPGAVTQVFENLLGNALRFAKTEIDVDIDARGGRLAVTVSDDGRGFSGRELIMASRPYCASPGDGKHFGLGLHICRTLCEKHGGELRLRNSPAGGAMVTAEFAMAAV